MSVDLLNAFKLVAPRLPDLFQEEIQVVLTDRARFTYIIESSTIKTTFKTGDRVLNNVPLEIAMRENKACAAIIPKEIYGHAFRATAYPICDMNNEVIGAIGIGRNFNRSSKIEKQDDGSTNVLEIVEESKKLRGAITKLAKEVPLKGLVGTTSAFTHTIDLALRTAKSNMNVILQGETGVGKEGFARLIHQASSRSQGPFIAVNCGAIPKELIASEFFGYCSGAFTGASPGGKIGKFEAAHEGTLFLDEITELPFEMQTYLLRVLQEKEVTRLGTNQAIPINVRILSATNRDLRQLVREGLFREDLFYRLNVMEIKVPSLRERREDFPDLINHFLNQNGAVSIRLRKETLRILTNYRWPGNVRELMNIVLRAIALQEDVETVLVDYVYSQIDGNRADIAPELKRDPITRTLAATSGNVAQTARILGLARSTVYRHLKEHAIKPDAYKHFLTSLT